MEKIKTPLIVCVILFAFSMLSVNAQQYCSDPNCPLNSVEITGDDTFPHNSVSCYEVPLLSGASYNWVSECDLNILCGSNTMFHAGFASPYYNGSGAGWVWKLVNGHWIQVWDENAIVGFTPPPTPWYCMIRCGVTYNGHTHWFAKEVIISGQK